MTLFNDGDSDFQGAPVGSADEPGLPVQEEADQRGQTNKAVGTWRPAGDFVLLWVIWFGDDWICVVEYIEAHLAPFSSFAL